MVSVCTGDGLSSDGLSMTGDGLSMTGDGMTGDGLSMTGDGSMAGDGGQVVEYELTK